MVGPGDPASLELMEALVAERSNSSFAESFLSMVCYRLPELPQLNRS
jgi:hypothetical protein